MFATFNSGGSSVNVNVYGWLNGGLTVSPVLSGGKCAGTGAVTCGITNASNVQTPWSPHNTPSTALAPNGFFELGLDLTAFYKALATQNNTSFNGVPCLSSFLADTRASGSQGNAVSSDLHDYVQGNLNTCGTTTKTSPKLATDGTPSLAMESCWGGRCTTPQRLPWPRATGSSLPPAPPWPALTTTTSAAPWTRRR